MKLSWPTGFGTLLVLLLLAASAPRLVLSQEATDAATRQYATAVRLQNLQSYDLAAEAWARFLKDFKTDPRVPKATHYLAVCYFHDGQVQQAVKTAGQLIADYPDFEMLDAAYLYLGVSQYSLAQSGNQEMYDTAAKTFNTLITKYPNGKFLPDALFYRGECLYMLDRKQDAAGLYAQMVENHPNHRFLADALYALGVAEEELEQFAKAEKTYRSLLDKFPNSEVAAEVRMRLGESLFAMKRFPQAAEQLATAAGTPGFQMADYATVRQADALAQLKQYVDAATLYASVPKKFPKSKYADRAALAGGKCFYLTGGYAQARGLLDSLLGKGGPSAPEAAHWVAKSLLKEHMPAEAVEVVEGVLPVDDDNEFAAQLLMDRADAVYEIPNRRAESIDLYASVAAKHAADPLAPQALYMAAFAALELGKYPVSLENAHTFLDAHTGHQLTPDVTHLAAESQLLLGKHSEAEELYTRLLKEFPDHGDSNLWRIRQALALQLQKKYKETVAALGPAIPKLKDKNQAAEALHLVGTSLLELGQFDKAIESLEAALTAAPKWRQADESLLALARAYRQSDNIPKAKSTVGRLIAEFPNSRLLDQAHYRLGEYCSLEDDLDAATVEYQMVIDTWPDSSLVPHALHELGCAQLSRKDAQAAEKTLTRMIDGFPEHKLIPQARYARAMARHQLDEYAPAIEDLEAVLASGVSATEKSDARYVLGLCRMGLEQFVPAATTFRTLLEEDPNYAGADNTQYQLAWSLKLAGEDAEAAKAFDTLAVDYAESQRAAEAHYHVAEFAYNEKDYQKASNEYYTAFEKAGKSELGEKACHKLAWSYYHQDNFDKAGKTFAYQRKDFPNGSLDADAAFMEAECLFKQDKFAEALAAYNKLEDLSNEQFQTLALLHAGQAAAQLKDWKTSLKLLTDCTDRFPDSDHFTEALYEQGWAEKNLNNSDKAVSLWQQVIDKTGREVAARAQFMIGEIQFENKDHSEAVKSFFKVIYGYSYPHWQGEAAYEAGRCFEVLNKKSQAIKLYQELVDQYPDSDKVPLAEKRLAELKD